MTNVSFAFILPHFIRWLAPYIDFIISISLSYQSNLIDEWEDSLGACCSWTWSSFFIFWIPGVFEVFWICVVVHMNVIMLSHISHEVFDDQNLVQTVNNICGLTWNEFTILSIRKVLLLELYDKESWYIQLCRYCDSFFGLGIVTSA